MEGYEDRYQAGDIRLAVGIPTVNRADLLVECLDDLAENMPGLPIRIIDNGDQGIERRHGLDMTVEVPGENIGVAASWNRLMRWGFQRADYVLLLNDDIVLGRATVRIQEMLIRKKLPPLVVGPVDWSVVLINPAAHLGVGDFDEDFECGGFEDDDFTRRLRLHWPGESTEQHPGNPPRTAGWGEAHHVSELLRPRVARSRSSADANPALDRFEQNRARYLEKWGGLPGHEEFARPWDQ